MTDHHASDWVTTTLGALGTFSTSSVDKKLAASEVPVNLINYMDIYRDNFIDERRTLMQTTASQSEITRSQVDVGDILFTPSSETPDDIGHSAVIAQAFRDTLHSYHTVRLRPNGSFPLDLRFSGWFANASSVLAYFASRATGSTRYTLTLSDFARAPVALPTTVAEQRQIASILDTMDEAIRRTEQLVAKLQHMKRGMLHDLLTRGIDDNGELRDPQRDSGKFKESSVGRVPWEWAVTELGRLVDPARPIVYGILMPGYGHPGGVPVVKVKDIVRDRIELGGLLLTSPGIDAEYARSRLKRGDLLFTIRGTVGRMAVVPPQLEKANITQDTARIAIQGANPGFVRAYLAMPFARRFVAMHTIGVAVKGINLRDVRRIPIAVPPREEADEIAVRLAVADSRLAIERDGLVKLRLLAPALMDDLLTGRVRVTKLLGGYAA